jgi:hypothetical protein
MSSVPPEGQPVQPYPAAPVVPVAVQPAVPVQVPVQASTVLQPVETIPQTHHQAEHPPEHPERPHAVYVYSHSPFLYWWPVWLTGGIMAVMTRVDGVLVNLDGTNVWFHRSKNIGVLFTLLFFLVILITNVALRGLSSLVAVLGLAFAALLLAYMGWWGIVLEEMGHVSIFMNLGFYVFFSTLVFLVWAFSVFVYDRMSYWRVTPGQITFEHVIGGAAKSYDTRGMIFEKRRQDLFRHWIIGLGSGDIEISTTGAKRETIHIPNVLFVDSKVAEIQQMIAMRPDVLTPPPPQ